MTIVIFMAFMRCISMVKLMYGDANSPKWANNWPQYEKKPQKMGKTDMKL